MSVIIREPLITDGVEIAKIHIEGMQKAYIDILDQDLLDGYQTKDFSWESRIADGHGVYLVAELDGRVVGIIGGGKPKNEEIYDTYKEELYLFYIKPEITGQGIGTKLFNGMIEKFRESGCNNFYVQVFYDNVFKRFYEKKGGIFLKNHVEKIGNREIKISSYGFNI